MYRFYCIKGKHAPERQHRDSFAGNGKLSDMARGGPSSSRQAMHACAGVYPRGLRSAVLIVLFALGCSLGSLSVAAESERGIVVVIGATGHQGSAVARELLARGYVVRAVTRAPAKPSALEVAALGAEVVVADLDESPTLDRALSGAYGVFGVTVYSADDREREVRHGRSLVDAARRAKIGHFVFSSVGSADRLTGIPHFDSKYEIELYLKASGLRFTILRPVAFMENWDDAEQRVADGVLRDGLRPTTRVQYFSVRDIGRFVAEAIERPKMWAGRELDIAGDALTMPEIALALGRTFGRDVSYQRLNWTDLRPRISAENEAMKRWFDAAGYDVDIRALRREFPWMLTFDEYLLTTARQER
jgi:uncharacterized protein YbjT (DUF2867 family)